MKCSICEFYEAENRDDLLKHQKYGHTPEQTGSAWVDESFYPTAATYTGGTIIASPSFIGLSTVSSSATSVGFSGGGTGKIQDFSASGGIVMSDGRVVMRVIQASYTHEIWERVDGSGTRYTEGHVAGDFDKAMQALSMKSVTPSEPEKEEEQSIASIYKKMRGISEAEERMIRESEIEKTNPALSPLESIEKLYGGKY